MMRLRQGCMFRGSASGRTIPSEAVKRFRWRGPSQYMDLSLWFAAIGFLVVGLVGQAFEMRRIRQAEYGQMGSPNIFTDRRNFKWYAIIGAGIAMGYAAERM